MRLPVKIFMFVFSLHGAAWAVESPPVMHGGGRAVTIAELNPGRFRTEVDTLPAAAKATALTWLSRMHFCDHDVADLHADSGGGIYYSCRTNVTGTPTMSPPAALAGIAIAAGPIAAGPIATVPIANQPSYHSKPGAPNRIYLDFNGDTVQNTAWNSGSIPNPLICPPFDIDGQPATFSVAEQTVILETWQRVAEDYAPFNVDVTTDPALETALTNKTVHTVITHSSIGVLPGSGGVAYVNVFGRSNFASLYSPAFVFFDALGSGREDFIAEACSHEIGHNVGLSHDATSSTSYYDGHGSGATSWGPIMGTGYNRNVSQFSKGEYYDSSLTQDDLSIIAGFLTYRPDDHGDTDSTATDISGIALSSSGIVGKTNDVDVLSFVCTSGPVSLTAATWQSPEHTNGGNLDVKMGLYDSSGALIVMSAPTGIVQASISTSVSGGTYFIRIANDGEGNPLSNSPSGYTSYGSLGQWTLTGTSVVKTATITATDSAASESGSDTGIFTITLSTPSVTPTTVAYTISGTAANGTDFISLGSSVTVPANATTVAVTVTPIDDAIVEGSETVIMTILNNNDYLSGIPNQATITISDNDFPSVSIAATDAQAAELGINPGLFTVTLSATVAQTTTVLCQVAGSAINGTDYSLISSSVTIPANTASATIVMTPIDDSVIEDPETIQLTVTSGTGYILGAPITATITIDDNDLPTANIFPTDADATETSGNTGLFTVTLSGAVSRNTTVAYQISGSATNGTDYSIIPSNVTIPANSTSATILVTPLADSLIEESETVQVTLSNGSDYTVGASATVVITVADNTPPSDSGSDSKCGLGGLGLILGLMLLGLAARRLS